jgi:hypothetical protein
MNEKVDQKLDQSVKLNQQELSELANISKYLRKIYNKGYSNAWRMMWFYFLRGVAYGLGVFLGGTIVVSAFLAILNFFGIKLN